MNAGTGTPFTTTSYSGSATLFCDIYGGSAFGNVNNSEVNLFSLAGTSFDYDVYGGGKGEFVSADNTANKYAKVTTKATVNMYATTITGHIYGGCNVHGLAGETEVNMYGGTLGTSGSVGDLLFGGGHGKETTTTKATVKVGSTTTSDDDPPITTYNEGSTIYSNVYGGSALGTVNDANVELYNATTTNLTGDVFGGGMGQLADGDLPAVQAIIGDATVNLYEAAIKENIYGGCNIYGVVNGKAIVNLIGGSVAKDVYGGGKGNATSFGTDGSVEVNVGTAVNTGSTSVAGDIYGGSALGHVTAPIVNVYSGTVSGSVFGGGKGALAATNTSATVSGKATVNMYGANIKALYGGCNLCGDVNGDTEVNVIGGNVTKDVDTDGVFGGGYGQNTSVTGDVTVNIGKYDAEATTKISGSAVITGDVYGGSAEGKVNTADETNSTTTKNKKTTVHLYAGQITGNVYGGGLGRKPSSATATDGIEAHEYGDVLVDLNNNDGVCYVDGSIFGCNNAYGSPSGTSEVHIYKTVHLTSGGDVTNEEPTTYELDAVYGGGDQAAYNGNSTKVVIENCDPSIEYVYGGGNAADVTNTYVEINGAKEIRTVFGGGNGSGTNNPGANVSGATQVYLKGGTIHEAFGGSNSKGIVANGTNVYVSDEIAGCPLNVDHVYGAGRNAGMRGKANIVLGCQPTTVIEDIYGGAESADIEGDIELTITSGHFKKVFGGNKSGGAIKGSVRLNIEETNNCSAPLIIDQLFGCGNEAPYSVYGYYQEGSVWKPRNEAQFNQMTADEKAAEHVPYDDPEVHIISFTEIGQVFGGGLGAPAMVYGNPKVFINQRPNYKTENATGESADKHVLGTIGAFSYPEGTSTVNVAGGVYGGGSEANVYGSTTVFIGSAAQVEMHSLPKVSGAYPMKYVEGANINCNVYGGGLKADVSGSTEVVIGADKVLSGATYTYPATTFAGTSETEVAKYKGIVITGDVFGAGQGETANVESAMVGGNGTVVMAGGSVKKSVYGGGQLSQVVGDTHVTVNGGTIGTAKADLPAGVTMGAVYGNVYGGGKGNTDNAQAGLIKGDTYITISDGTILHNIYGGGAYGSVGDFTFTTGAPSARTGGGTTNVTITGGTIGTDGHENGMIFGSSRGDVAKPVGTPAVDPNDKLAWVYDANVIIGTSGVTTGPQINGSVYGSGENGHTYRNTDIKIYSGTIGINSSDNVTIYDLLDNTKKVYEGKAYNYSNRGNVYGGGCGTDMYDSNSDGTNDTYNPLAGVVHGTTSVTITGGTVVHNVYGAGALGSVGRTTTASNGDITINSGGTTTIAISGGTVGVDGDGNGNVFGAARGDSISTQTDIALVKTTNVTISGSAQIKGNVYGGGQAGDVGTYHTVSDDDVTAGADRLTKGNNNYLGGDASGVCNVVITGGTIGTEGTTTAGHVFGAGKGAGNTYTCQKAMVKETSVTISNGTIYGDVYGGGEVGRVEHDATVTIGLETVADGSTTYYTYNDGNDTYSGSVLTAGTIVAGKYVRSGVEGSYVYIPIMASDVPIVHGNVFGAGAGLETHGYSALVRGNSTVTIQGNAAVRKNVYGGGKTATVGKYWVSHFSPHPTIAPPSGFPDGMPYMTRDGGLCTVTIQGNAIIGPESGDATETSGQVFGAGKGVNPRTYTFTGTNKPSRMSESGMVPLDSQDDYFQFLETLALASNTKVTIGGANVKGSVFGGSESGFVQDHTTVTVNGGTIRFQWRHCTWLCLWRR